MVRERELQGEARVRFSVADFFFSIEYTYSTDKNHLLAKKTICLIRVLKYPFSSRLNQLFGKKNMPNLPAKISLFNEINLALKEKKISNFLNKISLLNVMDFFAKSIVYFIYQNILTNKLLYNEVPNIKHAIL